MRRRAIFCAWQPGSAVSWVKLTPPRIHLSIVLTASLSSALININNDPQIGGPVL